MLETIVRWCHMAVDKAGETNGQPHDAVPQQQAGDMAAVLAMHCVCGHLLPQAMQYLRQAGEKAMARSAHREAVGYFEQTLSTLPHLPETRDTREQALDFRLALRSPLRALGEFGRMLASLHEAEALAAALNDPRRQGQVALFLSQRCACPDARTVGILGSGVQARFTLLAICKASNNDSSRRLRLKPLPYPLKWATGKGAAPLPRRPLTECPLAGTPRARSETRHHCHATVAPYTPSWRLSRAVIPRPEAVTAAQQSHAPGSAGWHALLPNARTGRGKPQRCNACASPG